jgi:hypothetical protein
VSCGARRLLCGLAQVRRRRALGGPETGEATADPRNVTPAAASSERRDALALNCLLRLTASCARHSA